jgi:hypothetical protein
MKKIKLKISNEYFKKTVNFGNSLTMNNHDHDLVK